MTLDPAFRTHPWIMWVGLALACLPFAAFLVFALITVPAALPGLAQYGIVVVATIVAALLAPSLGGWLFLIGGGLVAAFVGFGMLVAVADISVGSGMTLADWVQILGIMVAALLIRSAESCCSWESAGTIERWRRTPHTRANRARLQRPIRYNRGRLLLVSLAKPAHACSGGLRMLSEADKSAQCATPESLTPRRPGALRPRLRRYRDELETAPRDGERLPAIAGDASKVA